MDARQVLHDMYDLIAKGWTQGTFARDANARGVAAWSDDATCWCLSGAFMCLHEKNNNILALVAYGNAMRLLTDKIEGLNYRSLPIWNDTPGRTQEEVLELIDECIAELD